MHFPVANVFILGTLQSFLIFLANQKLLKVNVNMRYNHFSSHFSECKANVDRQPLHDKLFQNGLLLGKQYARQSRYTLYLKSFVNYICCFLFETHKNHDKFFVKLILQTTSDVHLHHTHNKYNSQA